MKLWNLANGFRHFYEMQNDHIKMRVEPLDNLDNFNDHSNDYLDHCCISFIKLSETNEPTITVKSKFHDHRKLIHLTEPNSSTKDSKAKAPNVLEVIFLQRLHSAFQGIHLSICYVPCHIPGWGHLHWWPHCATPHFPGVGPASHVMPWSLMTMWHHMASPTNKSITSCSSFHKINCVS